MKDVVIVSAARTAIGAFGGALKTVDVSDLGKTVIKGVLERISLRPAVSDYMKSITPDEIRKDGLTELESRYAKWKESANPVVIDEVIMGNVLQAAQGQNTARQAMIRAGLPKETAAYTINKVCGSGLKSIAIGAMEIMIGNARAIIAGGHENMSLAPMALPLARWGHRMELSGKGEIFDLMVFDGLYEIFYGYHMGVTAENIAKRYRISRHEQDELAVLSHQRALLAIREKWFEREIVPVTMKVRKKEEVFDRDERPMETDMEKMSQLRPAFDTEGSVTAGNASGINDGAAVVLLMEEGYARELGLEVLAKIKGFASAGVDPAFMGLGPVPAVRKVLKQIGMSLSDVDMIELNEAFAAQAIGCMRELGIPSDRPNELGSGISLGHPIGATGARQMVTALYQMKRKGYETGLISMCIGGGMGMAMVVER